MSNPLFSKGLMMFSALRSNMDFYCFIAFGDKRTLLFDDTILEILPYLNKVFGEANTP